MATELVSKARYFKIGEADVVLWSYRAEGLKGTCDMGAGRGFIGLDNWG